jgi:predicted RNA binding protein YcfA (HicA-like mRNA interferase family)
MSAKLPRISGRAVIRALQKIGYQQVRQRGSHIRLRCAETPNRKPVTVPDHPTIKPGLLRSIIRDAGLTVGEFVNLLDQ